MGLQLTTTTDSAVSANYYRIIDIRGMVGGSLLVSVGLYKDQDARTAGADYIERRRHTVDIDYSAASNILTLAYTALKELDEFTDAINA